MTYAHQEKAHLACIVLAHSDPTQVRRLVTALDPFPVFLHVDVRTPESQFEEMTERLPTRCTVLPRIRTGWARWENVRAEIAGYRRALETTDAGHFALLTGSDYPLASSAEIINVLDENRGKSIALIQDLPHTEWGQNGGFSRLRYRHWVFRKRMIRLPLPRTLPRDVVFAGGSQLKILTRSHAEAVVRAVDENPEIVRFWTRSWVADETFVPSILKTPRFVPDWADEHVEDTAWWIGWDGTRRKSPPWLGIADREALLSRRTHPGQIRQSLFARKFSTAESTELLDAVDAQAGRRSTTAASSSGRRS